MSGSPIGFRTKTDLVTEYLRGELQAGRPGPGERLVLDRVAERLGVSKVPVREAVTRLVGEGMLVNKPNVGPVVPAFTAQDVREVALMRVALESAGLPSAVDRHTPESIAEVGDLLQKMRNADEDYPDLNVEFHARVLAPTPYQDLYETVRALLGRAERYAVVHAVPGYLIEATSEHAEIFEALRARDRDLLVRLNARHVTSAAEKLARRIEAASVD